MLDVLQEPLLIVWLFCNDGSVGTHTLQGAHTSSRAGLESAPVKLMVDGTAAVLNFWACRAYKRIRGNGFKLTLPKPAAMVTLLLSSVLILGLILVAVYFWQKPASAPELDELPPPPDSRGLFPELNNPLQLEADTRADDVRAQVLLDAEAGDKSALQKARELRDDDLYDQSLTRLVTSIKSDAELLSLISHVTRNEWPVNKSLALACINSWAKTPDKSSTIKTLHIAALSDDADTFRTAAELAMQFWREGKVFDLSPIELNALLNGEFWVLSSATRSSGAGFVLKRSLASARRELEGTNKNN